MSNRSKTETETPVGRKAILLAMFFVLMIDSVPGMGIGFALGLSAKNLLLYLIILMIAFSAATNPKGIRFYDLDVHFVFLGLIGYAVLTWIISSATDPTYDELRGMITLKNRWVDLFLFMIAYRYGVNTRDGHMWLYRAVIITLLVSSFITLIDFLNIPDLGIVGTFKGRIEGPIGAANQYGALLGFLIPMSIAAVPSTASGKNLLLWRLGIVISAVLLIATGSRGATISIILGSTIGTYYLRSYLDMRQVAKFAGLAIATIFVLLLLFAIFNFEFLVERFEKSTSGTIETASSGRIQIWTAALRVMMEWPYSFVIGYGWNSFEVSGIWKGAHNEYLNTMFELGVIGLTLFVTLLLTMISRAKRSVGYVDVETRKILIGYVFGMFIIMINIFFVALPVPWAIIWIITGLVMGLQSNSAYNSTEAK